MRKIFLISLLIASVLILSFTSVPAQEEIKIYLGETKIISVSNPSRIAIGNPEVADVTNVTKSEITLSPKAAGTTTLVVWDNFGEQSYRVKVFAEDISEAKRRIDNMLAKLNLPEVYTQAEEEEGKVILLGRVKTPQERERITIALGPLKEKTVDLIEVKEEEAVVEIDVQVLELSKDASKTLGFTWPGSITITERGSPGITTSTQAQVGTTSTIAGGTAIGTKWSTLFKVLNLSRDAFAWSLDALVQEGKARVLSRPRLACQSGKEAELLVGGEKPIFTTSVAATTGAEGTKVEYKEYGIKLKIKPTVTDEDRMKLALNVEVSEVGTVETIGSTTAPSAKAYPLTKRSASTELFIDDGQTMVIGGLMKQKSEEDIRKTPWLGDIPILGLLFRKKTTSIGGGAGERGDTELFITLTPRIISQKKETKELKEEIIKPAEVSVPATKNIPQALVGYAGIIQKRVLENLTYPASARQAGFQGKTLLSLHLSYRGELLEAKVKSTSGYRMLDDNALSVAKSIVSYPPFPSSIEQKELWIDIPIDYRLD